MLLFIVLLCGLVFLSWIRDVVVPDKHPVQVVIHNHVTNVTEQRAPKDQTQEEDMFNRIRF